MSERTLGGSNGVMVRHPAMGLRNSARLVVIATLVAMLAIGAPSAHGVSAQGNITVTVTPPYIYQAATYTIGNFRVANKETVTGYTIVFPAGIDASGATSAGVGDTVTVQADNRTVTVMFGTPVPQRTKFTIELGNIMNPTTVGTYALTSVTFHRDGAADQAVALGTNGQFVIDPAPYLVLTITAPDPGQTVDFGTIDPGTTSASKTVTVDVDSSDPYTLTRAIAGDDVLMGLTVTGTASGVDLAAGSATYADDFVIAPPWTTDPDVVLAATVTYTVVQTLP